MGSTEHSEKPHHILVVDDEKIVLDAVREYLEIKGFTVDAAGSGEEALEYLGKRKVELMLSDIKMSGMSGIELLKKARRRYPETAVIMMTGFSETDAAVEAMKMGAFDYISKPFHYDELFMSIERALEKSRLLRLSKDYHNTLEQKVMEQSRKIREMFMETVSSLTSALEAKDEYTKGHSMRVTEYVQLLVGEMALDFDLKNDIVTAAQLHDIGKLGIADAILNKPGKLTDEEFDLIRQHPVTSEKILKPILAPQMLRFVRNHHERWDGKGYPDGLAGPDIPIGARIIALSDAFDAMTSQRAYRGALDLKWAFDEIERCSGAQFDPELAPVFVDTIRNFLEQLPQAPGGQT